MNKNARIRPNILLIDRKKDSKSMHQSEHFHIIINGNTVNTGLDIHNNNLFILFFLTNFFHKIPNDLLRNIV